jgi:multiple sugar transport system substrate-binding protein
MKSARKLFLLLLIFSISICCLPGCKKSELDKNKPVTLTMWHVYGEQADSPMNRRRT